MKDVQIFDQTFKVLLAIAASVWGVYVMMILFADDGAGCTADAFGWLFTMLAWTGGIMTALPLLYGAIRLLFWPEGPRGKGVWVPGLILGWGVSVFVAVIITFAIAASQFGCR